MNDVGNTFKENAKATRQETDRAYDFANVWLANAAMRARRRASAYRST